MTSARTWWTVGCGAILGASLGGAVAACSSDSAASGASGDDAGASQDSAPASDGGGGQDSAPGDSGNAGDTGGGTDCGIKLHPEPAGEIYCPSVAGDAGDQTCMMGQHCCMPGKMTGMSSNCQAAACGGTGMMAAKDWGCSGPGSCPANDVCCGVGTVGGSACTLQVQMFKSTSCKTSCDATEFIVCQATTDCMTGTCMEATAGGAPIGLCR